MNSFFNTVTHVDCLNALPDLQTQSVHMVLSDIPYGIGFDTWDVLHENSNTAFLGSSPAQEKAGAIFKKRGKPLNGWSEADRDISRQYRVWCSKWAGELFRVLKPGGSAFIFAGRRHAHSCVFAMEEAGFYLKDMIGWVRPHAPHRAQRISAVFDRRNDKINSDKWYGWRLGNLKPVFEPVLWLMKPYKVGGTIVDNVLEHGVGAYNESEFLKYADSPENLFSFGFMPGERGYHPTQKPVLLMEALIVLATLPGQTVLDPFAGSGSTLVAAQELNRNFIGFEINEHFVQIAKNRLGET